MIKKNNFILILYGPTGVGKTDCALALADRIGGEIVNMDVGALYTPLNIGTAKPDWRSSSIPHHLFDIIDTPRNLTVVEYRALIEPLFEAIWQRGKVPILVGGSGFYLKSLFYPPKGDDIKESAEYAHIEEQNLWGHLNAIDPIRAAAINQNDTYRIKRALDIWYATREKPSEYKPNFEPIAPFILFFLTRPRENLYARINQRVQAMIEDGWVQEVRQLRGTNWEPFIFQKKIIGYDDILNYFSTAQAVADEDLMIASIQKKTRNYAKRQFTFWRSLQKDLQDALAEYTDSNLVAQSYIAEVDVCQNNCVTCIEEVVNKTVHKQ